jgi:hypothetical protein
MLAEWVREKDWLTVLPDMTNPLVSNWKPRDPLRAISATIRQDVHSDLGIDPRKMA